MGGGGGRGMGGGGGRVMGGVAASPTDPPSAPRSPAGSGDLEQLKQTAEELRRQMEAIQEKIEEFEKK